MGGFEAIGSRGHEELVFGYDPSSGLKSIIAIHSTALGPALGGTRFFPYASEEEALEDVLRLVPELWRESQGIETFEVSSAVPVAPPQRLRLQAELERREGRPVFLEYRIDPGLVGGLSLRKGNIILDVSLRGRLAQLKERLIEG